MLTKVTTSSVADLMLVVFVTVVPVTLSSCAGPTTPLGALSLVIPENVIIKEAQALGSEPLKRILEASPKARVTLTPDRQVLHDRTTFRVIIDDPTGIPSDYKIKIFYNSWNVSSSFIRGSQKIFNKNRTRLELINHDLRLSAHENHQIEVRYRRNPRSKAVQVTLTAPECHPFSVSSVKNTGRFHPPDEWIQWIREAANEVGINPGMLTGLIAQESSFNPRALSWARALGLTQVTPLADEELMRYHSQWPRYDRLDKVPLPRLKALIHTGLLDAQDDWRLNPALSIKGGVTYLAHLNRYWSKEPLLNVLARHYPSKQEALATLLLASYNSGSSRVKKALIERGPLFLDSSELREAKKYVNRVKSYCYHFSQEVWTDENST